MSELSDLLRLIVDKPGSLLVLIGYVLFVLAFRGVFVKKRERERRMLGRFFSALQANLQADKTEDQARALTIIHRKLAETYPQLPEFNRGLIDLIETYVCLHDTLSDENLKDRYKTNKDPQARARAMTLVAFLRRENPFSSISPKTAALLRTLQHALEAGNSDLATNTLVHVSEEIEQLEGVARSQKQQVTRSFIVSVVGMILSVVFGLVSLVQFFRR